MDIPTNDACGVQRIIRGASLQHLRQLQGRQAVLRCREQGGLGWEGDDSIGSLVLGQPLSCLPVVVFFNAKVDVDSNLVHVDRDRHLAAYCYLHGQDTTRMDHSVGRVKMEIL